MISTYEKKNIWIREIENCASICCYVNALHWVQNLLLYQLQNKEKKTSRKGKANKPSYNIKSSPSTAFDPARDKLTLILFFWFKMVPEQKDQQQLMTCLYYILFHSIYIQMHSRCVGTLKKLWRFCNRTSHKIRNLN